MNGMKSKFVRRKHAARTRCVRTIQPPEAYITTAELAARLRHHVRSISLLAQRGLIPYYRFGRDLRFKWSEVDARLRRQCRVLHRNNSPKI